MTLVIQTPTRPRAMGDALRALANPNVSELRFAVAYTTRQGLASVLPDMKVSIGPSRWAGISKTIITSMDYGLTEPAALEWLLKSPDNYHVQIANPEVLTRSRLAPKIAFHPKIYVLIEGRVQHALIGSANLTDSGLTVNTEVGVVLHGRGVLAAVGWAAIARGCVDLTPALLDRYKAVRPVSRGGRKETSAETKPVTEDVLPVPIVRTSLETLLDAIAGGFAPDGYDSMWVEAGAMKSGGASNQLELPRGGNLYFGYTFSTYTSVSAAIGSVTLLGSASVWPDRSLRWHGHNRMERLNLPTLAKGGVDYANTAILFIRELGGYRMEVRPWMSADAIAWRNASQRLGTMFRLGAGTERLAGFF